ncbi:sialate:O-sulfotransferase 1-like [Ruditapes philippinarum]|uniref:sialate:O-sulfotransferase 1-like n=1 Tax=Ruditapes philippinarum TaxID=129788 RepID=UPI00295AB33A|nr:sialate:O-sulfotransferase 1-like [Ruditapes philippinarum]
MNFKRDNAWIFRQMSQFQISLVFVIMLNLGPLQVEASLDKLIGCFKDGHHRVLNGNTTDLYPNGRKECKQYCQGYRYFGTESGEECFCGNEIRFYNMTALCTYICEGNPDEYCGGHWRIMIYDTQSYVNTSTTSSTENSASTHRVTETSKSTSPQSSVNPMIETSKSTSQKPSTNHDTLSTHKPVRKTNTGDDKISVSYLYILLPVGIVVIAVILVIIFCKRR